MWLSMVHVSVGIEGCELAKTQVISISIRDMKISNPQTIAHIPHGGGSCRLSFNIKPQFHKQSHTSLMGGGVAE